jgi:nucleoside-diphosphate-sugar epimerase
MRILVTGGTGRLGQFTLADLEAHGHEAINASRRPGPPDGPGAGFVQVDLTDVGAVAGAMKGCDAVIHLGAIPAPWRHPDEIIFGNNTMSTFAVLQAAHLFGIGKVVIASSVSAYGMAWTKRPFGPLFAPLDESHPFLVADPYGLAKETDERTAEMFYRRCDMQVLALRFHWVANEEELRGVAAQGGVAPVGDAAEDKVAAGGLANNLWGYVEGRDAAAACRLGLEADGLGFEAFNIVAADTLCAAPTMELLAEYLPETEIRKEIPGTGGGFDIGKAEQLLGWVPQHSWRDSS